MAELDPKPQQEQPPCLQLQLQHYQTREPRDSQGTKTSSGMAFSGGDSFSETFQLLFGIGIVRKKAEKKEEEEEE